MRKNISLPTFFHTLIIMLVVLHAVPSVNASPINRSGNYARTLESVYDSSGIITSSKFLHAMYKWMMRPVDLDNANSDSVYDEDADAFYYFFMLEADLVISVRQPGLTLYQALSSITFEPGFETEDGAEFTAEVLDGLPSLESNLDMNWTFHRALDAQGRMIVENKYFYNKAGSLIQTQQKRKFRKDAATLQTHVMAYENLYDAMGRKAGVTLPAPINKGEFEYKSSFVLNADGSKYDYRNFDRYISGGVETDKTNNPDQVGGQAVPGTLGWYYSSNNNWEPYTPTSKYPFTRSVFFRDGTVRNKQTTTVGEPFKMGTGKQPKSFMSPVYNELSHYFQVRNKFYTSAEMGNMIAASQLSSGMVMDQDINGDVSVSIHDAAGKTLMTAKAGGSELVVNNSFTVAPQALYNYAFRVNQFGVGVKDVTIKGDNIKIFESQNNGVSYSIIYEGAASSYSSTSTLLWMYRIESETSFSISFTATPSTGPDVPGCIDCIAKFAEGESGVKYFSLSSASAVSVTGGSFSIIDLSAYNEPQLSFISGNTLPAGYYKILNTGTTPLTINYSNGYSDVTYNFYNQKGLQVAGLAPEGVKKLYGSGMNNYSSIASIPFAMIFTYDNMGRLRKTQSTDAGMVEVICRSDGSPRFSQNEEQRITGRYSYINLDAFGRVIEVGEYQPDANGIQFNGDLYATTNPMAAILDNTSATGGLTTGTKKDVVTTFYDFEKNTHGQAGYTQTAAYLTGMITYSAKYSSVVNNVLNSANLVSSSWFNYNERGRQIWTVKYISGLGYITEDVEYDADGRAMKRLYQKTKAAETFVHFFEYDSETQQLYKVYTNTQNSETGKKLHATYYYYLHGPLKRIEMAEDLQGVDFTYGLAGVVKAINNNDKAKDPGGDGTNGFKEDAYGFVFDYFPKDYENDRTTGIQPIKGINTTGIVNDSYEGNIKAASWFTKKPASVVAANPGIEAPTAYVFKYDDKQRIQESFWGTNLNFNNSPVTFTNTNNFKESVKNPANGESGYDANGNILYLQRTDASGATTDNFSYNYITNTNKLESVTNQQGSTSSTYASYQYNSLGQLIRETNANPNKTKYLQYDPGGKLILVARDAAFTQKVVEFEYDETGKRLKKKSYNSNYQLETITYYAGPALYTQTLTGGVPGTATLQELQVTTSSQRIGVFYKQSNVYAYELKDQVGNVRAVIAKSGSSMEVRMYSDYYPFGMVIRQGGSNDYRYGFQGQYSEKDAETDWNAFELRMYDSRIARWLTTDPASQYFSPYVAMGNNPVMGADPTGALNFVEAFFFKLTHPGNVDITWNGKQFLANVDEFSMSNYNMYEGTYDDLSFNQIETKWFGTNTWSKVDWGKRLIIEASRKLTVGAQAKIDIGSFVNLEGGYAVVTLYEEKWGWNGFGVNGLSHDTYFDHVGEDSKVEDFLSVWFGVANMGAGVKLSSQYKTYHTMGGGFRETNEPRDNNVSFSKGFSTGKAPGSAGGVYTETFSEKGGVKPSLDLSFSLRAVLGLDWSVKAGIRW